MNLYNGSDVTFGLRPESRDDTGEVLELLAGAAPGRVISLSGRDYHFHPGAAPRHYLCPSNNRNGEKPVAFPLRNLRDVVIEGNGSRLVFHGGILPFWLHGCRNVTLRNFSIDWHRPFYSQGVVTGCDERGVEFEMDLGKYPCHLEDGRLVFDGEGWSSPLTQGVFEIDAATGAPAWRSGDNLRARVNASHLPAVDLGGGRFRIEHAFPHRAELGNILLLRHFLRHFPGIFMEHSKDVRIEGVALHHCSAMGVIGQMCENVAMERMEVVPAPGSGRMFSVAVDSTHFVNCKGLVSQRHCRFSHQMDDPCNIGGINARFHCREDARSAVFERVHFEQWGAPLGEAGDRVQLCSNVSLLPYAELTLESLEEVDERFVRYCFREPLPDRLGEGDVAENLTWTPDFHVADCDSGPNRARGYLVSTPGKVVIENSRISAAGAAVKISGDANYWFESGAVRDVTIRNNVFTDCCYGPPEWGTAVIDIDPEIVDPWAEPGKFHRNIRIIGNTFRVFDPSLLYARSVEGIEFSGNKVEWTATRPPSRYAPGILNFDACSGITVRDNVIAPVDGVSEQVINDAPPGCRRWAPQASLDANAK